MFVRYLGGGIGHTEQFPSTEDDGNETAVHNDGNLEVEMDDFIAPKDDGANDDSDEGEEDEEDNEGEEDEEDNTDPGESSDEETGNVY
jgi:hypothetical protein